MYATYDKFVQLLKGQQVIGKIKHEEQARSKLIYHIYRKNVLLWVEVI